MLGRIQNMLRMIKKTFLICASLALLWRVHRHVLVLYGTTSIVFVWYCMITSKQTMVHPRFPARLSVAIRHQHGYTPSLFPSPTPATSSFSAISFRTLIPMEHASHVVGDNRVLISVLQPPRVGGPLRGNIAGIGTRRFPGTG